MAEKPEHVILYGLTGVLLIYVILIGVTALGGAYHMPFWTFGVLLFISFLALAIRFRSRYKELPIFLGVLFFLIWVYPTLAYFLYLKNEKNYEISESFLENEKVYIEDNIKNEIPLNDLRRIKNYLESTPFIDTLKFIEIPERYDFDNTPSGLTDKRVFVISKNDSFKTEIFYRKVDPAIEKFSILNSMDRKIEDLQRLIEFKEENTFDIPYSEFWVEAFMGFKYGDIKPARNIPKILNALPLICYLLLGTILVKYSLESNEEQKNKGKKKKKNKGY
ncbi:MULTISPECIES: hypothetical protein [Flagellimonas]|uniref:Uncharacterized protein n=1 Tax=Flagellimonas hadalis TaxID=2597517 RepID=A0A5N5IU68_9FLAO|nr:hypothetical protein [Allomuricauda hadalis]KAB5491764.1 hypothetical protein FOT42_002090 [Allomuricauda hadalis]